MSILTISNFKKKFKDNVVLNDINFSIEKGDVLSVLGQSGCGKTTLLRCINFLEKADDGQIYVEDKLIYDYSKIYKKNEVDMRKLQLNFGLVFQSFNLFPQYTALENVMLAPLLFIKEKKLDKLTFEKEKEILQNRAEDLLKKVGLEDKMNFYPCELSGGQNQRVSIARCLILEPKVLFFDEPTSALDPFLTNEVLKIMKELANRKFTMVVVTHEIKFAREVSNKVLFMSHGNIIEQGLSADVIDNPKMQETKEFLSGFKYT